jgi:hypothetical protein
VAADFEQTLASGDQQRVAHDLIINLRTALA